MGKIIAITTPKGGVGKTTTAVNLAIGIAQNGKRVLLLDLDGAGQCAPTLGFKSRSINGDILDVLSFKKSFKSVIHKTSDKNLDFIPMRGLDYAHELKLSKFTSDELIIKSILSDEIFSYNYVIVDCPPSLIGTTTNILMTADSTIIPVKASRYSLNEVVRILKHMQLVKQNYNSKLKVEGILLTMYEAHTRAAFYTKKILMKEFPNELFNIVIPKNVEVAEATFHNKPIIYYNPEAKSSIAYKNLAEEIVRRNSIPILD
ncbi:MAG: ParA family protein [Ignavibacteriae bacterium]|nr:ParA family protein [Ignavibacteriota bacterium]MCB9206158.1 ParA family protein [Ignavibacteriales bacterium]MCB9209431.1 ParA family protein [Ignavibacteriales bacterium]MCB9258074.1 ParA family protein [Ignavibacteriales bacterium]